MEESTNQTNSKDVQKSNSNGDFAQIFFYLLAIAVIIMFFIGAGEINTAGDNMSTLRSVGGKSVDEAFYQYYGKFLFGLVYVVRALGIALGGVLIYIGSKCKK